MNFDLILILLILFGGVLAGVFTACCGGRALAVLQQQNYSGAALVKWFGKRGNSFRKRLCYLTLFELLLVALFLLCFSFAGNLAAGLCSAVPFFGLEAVFLYAEHKVAVKVPLRRTARAKRLIGCYAFLLCALYVGLGFALAAISFAVEAAWFTLFRFLPLCLIIPFTPFVLALASWLMKVYEIPHSAKFVKQAKHTLAQSPCKKIAVTGSAGKTSVKNILKTVLGSKYRVMATPSSYNTPLGIARYVNAEGADCDFFIVEMGARKKGDISELCDMVCPDFGMVTSVNPQHLQTFGSIEAIASEKGVLAVRSKEGCAVGISAAQKGIVGTMVEGEDFSAEEIELTPTGTAFSLSFGGNSYRVTTKLLGKNAAHNIAMAAAVSLACGMSAEEILAAIPKLEPVPHRLQPIVKNGLTVLDDSYNCNTDGAEDALSLLRTFAGKKAVVTPGIVELGELEERENEKLGEMLVGLDRVILVGETLVLSVRNGYLREGGNPAKLVVVPTLEKAQEELAQTELGSGDAVLFLNDLPDCYL